MDCDIYIEVDEAAPWLRDLCALRKAEELNLEWWAALKSFAGTQLGSLLGLSGNENTPLIKGCESAKSGKVKITLWGGSESYPFVEFILPMLLSSGCNGIEAQVYTDECEYVEEDDHENLAHRLGTKFYIEDNAVHSRDCAKQ
jgi:hypothetical protein